MIRIPIPIYIIYIRIRRIRSDPRNISELHISQPQTPHYHYIYTPLTPFHLHPVQISKLPPILPSNPMSIHTPSTADGWHGIIPSPQFPAEKGRYHLYIGLFCPFAHRVNFIRHLKGLTDIIDISIVKPYPKGDENGWPGWRFPASDNEYPGATTDRLFGEDYMHKIYFRADPEYKGRYSVPLLWDKKTGTVVCNVCYIFKVERMDNADEFRKALSFSAGYQRLSTLSSHPTWLQ